MEQEIVLEARPGSEVLFFDLAELDRLDRVVLSVEEARKHPHNPILQLGDKDAWDCAQASPWAMRTVIYDAEDKVFKCWYNGTDLRMHSPNYAGYAVSADGVVWEKPNLGVFEFEGSTRNNIILNDPYGCVIKDEAEYDPARRYKMRVTGAVRYSADGIRWTDWIRLNVPPTEPKPWDAVAFVRDDFDPDPARRYKYVYQYYDRANKPGPELVRHKALVFGADECGWQPSAVKPMLGPNDGFEHENHFLMFIPYKGQYVVLYECGWYHPDGTGRYGRYLADIRLAHSRDGEHFTRINPHQAVIAIGEPGEWDGQFIVITDKAILKDDTIYLYYCGQGRDWTSWPPANAVPGDRTLNPKTGKGATGNVALSRMGLAMLRADRFTAIGTVDGRSFGSLTTKPIRVPRERAQELRLNLSGGRPGVSWLTVEVLDAAGVPLPGFAESDCPRLFTDSVRLPIRWRSGGFGAVSAPVVRLRFHLYGNAKLHAFAFA